ncbi:MAG: 50S ribosome-binding GTPase [bacterium]|nr:50S ribosome-binding GTPase [bacterium]
MARVSRTIIGFFGRVNAGKSTAMNLLTRQPTSLVDAAPGTTADVRDALAEIHALGPARSSTPPAWTRARASGRRSGRRRWRRWRSATSSRWSSTRGRPSPRASATSKPSSRGRPCAWASTWPCC